MDLCSLAARSSAIYTEFGKDARQTDCTSCSHLEKMQSCKDIKNLDTFLDVWDNLMLNL